MPGRILIVDDVATHRIVLKVKLASASYDVILAESLEAGAAAAATQAPALVVLSGRIGGEGGAERLCRQLRADPAAASVAILVLDRRLETPRRLSLFAAGADEVLEQPLDEALLLAQVRRLLRQRAERQPAPALGLAEAAVPFEMPGLVCLVAAPGQPTARLRQALAAAPSLRITTAAAAEVLDALRAGPIPDLFVIDGDPPDPAALRLVAELRARPGTASAAVVLRGGDDIDQQIMALDLGAAEVIAATADPAELALRVQLRLRQKQEGDRRRAEIERGLQLAVTDPLTGLANRRAAFARLDALAGGAAGSGGFALMILDIDRFKTINDRHGHIAGDRVLAEVAGRLRQNLSDVDLLARFGGEEFLVVLPDTALVPARLTAERLRRTVEAAPVTLETGEQVWVTLSIGLCLGPCPAGGIDDAIARADRALYAAKARGRNTVTISQSVA